MMITHFKQSFFPFVSILFHSPFVLNELDRSDCGLSVFDDSIYLKPELLMKLDAILIVEEPVRV